jgi:hypothetical protein
VRVDQYEVLGNEAKSHVRPAGTIETLGFWFRTRLSDCQHSSIVPSGTESYLKTLTQHFVLGYFRQVPAPKAFGACGTDFSLTPTTFASPDAEADEDVCPFNPRLMCSCRSAIKMCSKQFGYRLLAIGYLLLPIFQKRDILLRQRNICAPEGVFQVSNILWPNQRKNREGLI